MSAYEYFARTEILWPEVKLADTGEQAARTAIRQ
jgi:hypothetical protein